MSIEKHLAASIDKYRAKSKSSRGSTRAAAEAKKGEPRTCPECGKSMANCICKD